MKDALEGGETICEFFHATRFATDDDDLEAVLVINVDVG